MSKETRMRYDRLSEALDATAANLADLTETVEELHDRVDDLENPEDEDEETEDGDITVDTDLVLAVNEIGTALASLSAVTAATAVLNFSGPYAADGFTDEVRRSAKRIIENRVRYTFGL
jgi:hypothetical protein